MTNEQLAARLTRIEGKAVAMNAALFALVSEIFDDPKLMAAKRDELCDIIEAQYGVHQGADLHDQLQFALDHIERLFTPRA